MCRCDCAALVDEYLKMAHRLPSRAVLLLFRQLSQPRSEELNWS